VSVPETIPTVKQLKQTLAGYIQARVPELAAVYAFEPGRLNGLPCVTLMSRRFDPVQAETGPHDDMTYDFRMRLYVSLHDYEKAQDEIDDLIPIILDVGRHHATMEGAVDFLSFIDSGSEIIFSKDDGWAAKDVLVRVIRTEL